MTVCCAVLNFDVLGPYFFEEGDVTVTVTSDRHCAMFQPHLGEIFSDQHGSDNVWFQQDGATAHTSRRSLSLLREMFPGHVISLRGDIGWPPRSPDLTPCDFYLWDYLKAKVYGQHPITLEALKEARRQEVAAITPEMVLNVIDNYRERLHQCINIQGRHLSDVLFKTHCCKTAFCVLSRNKKTFAVSSLVLNLFASQIGEFFLPHSVHKDSYGRDKQAQACRTLCSMSTFIFNIKFYDCS